MPIIVHEIGHALGLYHEQMRPDRDNYVTINMENVLEGKEENFDKLDETDVDLETVPYDLLSIMHYGKLFMSKNKKANLYTIEPIDPEYLDKIGNAESASFTDIKMVNHMYKCGALCASIITCPPEGFLGKDCKCFCPSDSDGTAAVDCRDRNPCDTGFIHKAPFCLRSHSKQHTFDDAVIACQEENAHLITEMATRMLHSTDFTDIPERVHAVDNYNAWVGVKRNVNSAFVWLSSDDTLSNYDPMWGNDEPSNKGGVENCVEWADYHNGLNDLRCSTPTAFICEKSEYDYKL